METKVARLRARRLLLQIVACALSNCALTSVQASIGGIDDGVAASVASASAVSIASIVSVAEIDRPDSVHHRLTGMPLVSSAPNLSNAQQRSADIAATVTVVTGKNITPASVPSVAADAPQLSSQATQKWEMLASDRTLNAALARWSRSAGWQMVWELPVDYSIDAHASISGTFEDAIAAVSRSMEQAEVPMNAIFYDGNKVLRIVVKGRE
ncbi:PilL domain protein [Collimonas arenae]|uniref:PilL domain protein n=1 Tax=Collimonas arenae TaxID=279058 RepID=A0A0A1F9W0_9BURK|nr:toxin co-regulated pilus biosynthesis Q family protein [Collimonas arenae]AIY39637.1 PilL domain protein [Collimonas arenae]